MECVSKPGGEVGIFAGHSIFETHTKKLSPSFILED